MGKTAVDVLISPEELGKRVQVLGEEISQDFKEEAILVICLLKGGVVFCADLIRTVCVPLELEFIKCASYGDGQTSTGTVHIELDVGRSIEGKNVLIVEDIVDTGITMNKILNLLQKRNPKTLKVAALLSKPSRRQESVSIDYLGFEVEDKFIVGYGLDSRGLLRSLPYIGALRDD